MGHPILLPHKQGPNKWSLPGFMASHGVLLSPLSHSAWLPISCRHCCSCIPRGSPSRPWSHRVQHLQGCSAPTPNPCLWRVSVAPTGGGTPCTCSPSPRGTECLRAHDGLDHPTRTSPACSLLTRLLQSTLERVLKNECNLSGHGWCL